MNILGILKRCFNRKFGISFRLSLRIASELPPSYYFCVVMQSEKSCYAILSSRDVNTLVLFLLLPQFYSRRHPRIVGHKPLIGNIWPSILNNCFGTWYSVVIYIVTYSRHLYPMRLSNYTWHRAYGHDDVSNNEYFLDSSITIDPLEKKLGIGSCFVSTHQLV